MYFLLALCLLDCYQDDAVTRSTHTARNFICNQSGQVNSTKQMCIMKHSVGENASVTTHKTCISEIIEIKISVVRHSAAKLSQVNFVYSQFILQVTKTDFPRSKKTDNKVNETNEAVLIYFEVYLSGVQINLLLWMSARERVTESL